MKLGIALSHGPRFAQTAAKTGDSGDAGVERVMVADAYPFDAVTLIGYVAAPTHNTELALGTLPMYSRIPTNLAMTAAGVDDLSGGRCEKWQPFPFNPERANDAFADALTAGKRRGLPP